MDRIDRKLPPLPLQLKNEILEKGVRKKIPAGTEILREGQYVKVIPLVLDGSLKVFSSHGDKDLLLYYIEPAESCIMSFSAGLGHFPSKVFAVAEKETDALLLPVELVSDWIKRYPSFNDLFYRQFNQRYEDLLHTIHQVLFERLDKRVLDYLEEKSKVFNTKKLNLRHHEIAREMGTVREVISRVLKKLEKENKVHQHAHYIEML